MIALYSIRLRQNTLAPITTVNPDGGFRSFNAHAYAIPVPISKKNIPKLSQERVEIYLKLRGNVHRGME